MNEEFENPLYDELNQNPIFQLSLASKELFHSNFLYWLSMIDDKKEEFRKLINELAGEHEIKWPSPSEYVVRKEEKHFDLCIRRAEKEKKNNDEERPYYFFVLENKFKSIVHKEQLDDYHDEVRWFNATCSKSLPADFKTRLERYDTFNDKCVYCLLTLANNFLEKEVIEKDEKKYWNIVSYSVYADAIYKIYALDKKPVLEPDEEDQKKKKWYENYIIIKLYYDYINTISREDFFDLPNINDDTWDKMVKNVELAEMRIDSLRQKLCFNLFALEVKKILESKGFLVKLHVADEEVWKEEGSSIAYLDTDYGNEEGIVMLSYKVSECAIIRFEIQGSTYKRGIILKKGEKKEAKEGEEKELTPKEIWDNLPDTIKGLFLDLDKGKDIDITDLPKDFDKKKDNSVIFPNVFREWNIVKNSKQKILGTYDTKNLMKYRSTQVKDPVKDPVKKSPEGYTEEPVRIIDVAKAMVQELLDVKEIVEQESRLH